MSLLIYGGQFGKYSIKKIFEVQFFPFIFLIYLLIYYSFRFKDFIIADKPLFITYSIIGWGGPLCFLIVSLIAHHVDGTHLKPGFGNNTCWFNGKIDIYKILIIFNKSYYYCLYYCRPWANVGIFLWANCYFIDVKHYLSWLNWLAIVASI